MTKSISFNDMRLAEALPRDYEDQSKQAIMGHTKTSVSLDTLVRINTVSRTEEIVNGSSTVQAPNGFRGLSVHT